MWETSLVRVQTAIYNRKGTKITYKSKCEVRNIPFKRCNLLWSKLFQKNHNTCNWIKMYTKRKVYHKYLPIKNNKKENSWIVQFCGKGFVYLLTYNEHLRFLFFIWNNRQYYSSLTLTKYVSFNQEQAYFRKSILQTLDVIMIVFFMNS